jgi:NitT/TauT family transport system substrate-binding protein
MNLRRFLSAAVIGLAGLTSLAHAAPKSEFNVCWSIYAGWMPWEYAGASGIMDKWAKKYNIKVKITQINDYVESINQYTAGKFDGCSMASMDALTIPAVAGVDSTALVIGDYSNGNDGIVLKGKGKTVKDLKGLSVNLVEFSVSHYLLARALDKAGLSQKDVTVVNTSDADIVAVAATPATQAVVTWKPQLATVAAQPDTSLVFDSSSIPGEILDMMVVNTATLKENPALGKALTGAWYEIMALMRAGNTAALTHMAQASGTDLAGYKDQLATTALYYTAADTLKFTTGKELPAIMKKVAQFSFDQHLLGDGAKSADVIGMAFPGGVVVGDKKNVKLRFDETYVKLAAENKL